MAAGGLAASPVQPFSPVSMRTSLHCRLGASPHLRMDRRGGTWPSSGVVSGPCPGQWCLGKEGSTRCRLCVVFVLGDVPSPVLVSGSQEGCGGSCMLAAHGGAQGLDC